MVAEVFEYPFDLAKVRLQAQVLSPVSPTTVRFNGPMHCLSHTWKEEGLRGLYRVCVDIHKTRAELIFLSGSPCSHCGFYGRDCYAFPSVLYVSEYDQIAFTKWPALKFSTALCSTTNTRRRWGRICHQFRLVCHFLPFAHSESKFILERPLSS